VLEVLNIWFESARFAYEVQGVISMRLMRLAQGGPQAAAEADRMIAEKLDALADAEVALLNALAHGEGFATAAERAYLPVRSRVHANSRRLSGAADHDAANAFLKASGMAVATG
jgi:hypothetical protein